MADRPSVRTLDGDILHEEIRWLASFGWNNTQIARKLHVSVSAVEAHLTGKQMGPDARRLQA